MINAKSLAFPSGQVQNTMAQYYNVVTQPNGTLTLEDIQKICGLEGQSVQLVVEDNPNVISQPFLLTTAPVDNTEQTIITQPTISVGTQLSTASLDQR